MRYTGLNVSPGAIAAWKWGYPNGVTGSLDELLEIPADKTMPSEAEMAAWETEYLAWVADQNGDPLELRVAAIQAVLEERDPGNAQAFRDKRAELRDRRTGRR